MGNENLSSSRKASRPFCAPPDHGCGSWPFLARLNQPAAPARKGSLPCWRCGLVCRSRLRKFTIYQPLEVKTGPKNSQAARSRLAIANNMDMTSTNSSGGAVSLGRKPQAGASEPLVARRSKNCGGVNTMKEQLPPRTFRPTLTVPLPKCTI